VARLTEADAGDAVAAVAVAEGTATGRADAVATLPLLAARDLDAPLCWRAGVPISARQFLGEALALAETLPARGRPVNLCQDRYHFALGLAAALLRGQTSLMPPNALPETLAQLHAGAGGASADGAQGGSDEASPASAYALVDAGVGPAELDVGGLQRVPVARPAVHTLPQAVPAIAVALVAVCLLTSGSTGAPQPHAKRWGPLVANIAAEAERLAQHLQRPSLAGLTLVATVPAQHSYGFESSVLLALLGGAAFDAGRPFYPQDIAAALAAVPAPRALVTTPFHLKALLGAGVVLPPTALTLSATAPLAPQLAAQAETALSGQLVEIYGCTEAGQVASRRTTAGEVWTTLGALRIRREPAPAVPAGQAEQAEQAGERAEDPAPAPGEADEAASERFIVSGGHVSESTPLGDVLELLSPTQFRLLGRANDLIHVAGKRSSLAHLNFQLNRVEGVLDGAIWLPDAAEGAGEVVRPVAFVVAPGLSAGALIAALRQRLDAAFVPRRVLHVAALPREATGKLTAQALRAFALRTLAGQAPAASSGAAPDASGVSGGPGVSRAENGPPLAAAAGPLAAPLAASFAASLAASPAAAVPAGPGAAADGLAAGPNPAAGSACWQVPADHPAFAGHFPGHPVLPGVVLLAWVQHSLPGPVARIDSAKFLAPVGPGAALVLQWQPQGSGWAFEIRQGTTTVARGVAAA
jgi:hypothetical protein